MRALWLMFLLFALLPCGAASGQASWEYSPYAVRIWVALAPAPELTETLRQEVMRVVVERAELTVRAAWDVAATAPPASLRTDIVARLDSITVDDIAAADPTSLQGDKLYLVSLSMEPDCYRIRAKELDCRSRSWGDVVERRVEQPELLAASVFAAVQAVFAPLARIDEVRGNTASGRIRAGGLILREDSPARITVGAVLRPIIRRNDRLGQPMPGGIQVVPWTLLQVASQAGAQIECEVHSGMRNPIRGRSSSRTERLALAARPGENATLLRLESREEPPQPLVGYELYAKDSPAAADEPSETMELIGRTDWRGVLEVPPSDDPLRILYVKNGGQVVARLPLVPGCERRLTAQLPNDDLRLQAEACIRGFQTTIMDLVAQRAVLGGRIRRWIKEGKSDEAKKLIDQFRSLSTRSELANLLREQRQQLSSPDSRLQQKIDKLFADTESLMSKYLDPGEADRLDAQLTSKSGE